MPLIAAVPTFASTLDIADRYRAVLNALGRVGVPDPARLVLLAHLMVAHGPDLERTQCFALGPLPAEDAIEIALASDGTLVWRPGPRDEAVDYYVEGEPPHAWLACRSLRAGAQAFANAVRARPAVLWEPACGGALGRYADGLQRPDPISGAPPLIDIEEPIEFGPTLAKFASEAARTLALMPPERLAEAARDLPVAVAPALGRVIGRQVEKAAGRFVEDGLDALSTRFKQWLDQR